MRTLGFLTFPLVLTPWAYAAPPSAGESVAASVAGPLTARFTATADPILAQVDETGMRGERGDIVVAVADTAKQAVPAEPQGKGVPVESRKTATPAKPQETFGVDVMVILGDEEVAGIDRSVRINKLKLTGPRVTNAALKDLHQLASVDLLSIENTQITNAGLELLEKMNLRSLRLWQRSFNDSALKQVRKLTKLESLDVEGTQAGGAEVAQLLNLANLQTLVLGSATEDAQMGALSNFSALRELDLRGCRNVSDAGVLRLRSLTNLQALWLPQHVTREAESQLIQKLPKCKIQR